MRCVDAPRRREPADTENRCDERDHRGAGPIEERREIRGRWEGAMSGEPECDIHAAIFVHFAESGARLQSTQQGSTLILVTHNQELSTWCDRRLKLEGGRLR